MFSGMRPNARNALNASKTNPPNNITKLVIPCKTVRTVTPTGRETRLIGIEADGGERVVGVTRVPHEGQNIASSLNTAPHFTQFDK